MNLRKTFFILPNLFTLGSVFCGFFAITTVASGEHPSSAQLFQAAIAILFGVFFDIADGRVARLTKTQSALGLQLDSLADVITFGVAPAVMMYRWGLDGLRSHIPYVGPHIGLVLTFIYLACAALRLARFNVLAIAEKKDDEGPGKYILGLAVPVAAAVLVSLVVVSHQVGGSYVDFGQAAVSALMLVLSYLMVSRVRFRSFKDLKLSRRTVSHGVSIVCACVVAVFYSRVPSAFVLVGLLATYVVLGLFEELVFYRQHLLAAQAARTSPDWDLAEGGARSDDEVLAELGAFDRDPDDHPALPKQPHPARP